jgi:hypothetical protein
VDRAEELGAGWGSLILGRIQEGCNMQDIMMPDLILTDSEWREISWQEPGIFRSFGDGIW